jgi:lysophospholipase L1-like esterase
VPFAARSARRLAALAFGLALALALVEAGIRAFAPQPEGEAGPLLRGPLTEPGDHRVRTGEYDVTLHVNAAGFVDGEWPPAAPGGVAGGGAPRPKTEIVVLGDSFVQAAQVPPGSGFGPRLEAALAEQGVAAHVLSMGVPGAGTATALGVLRTYALPRRPDLIVLGFLVANDVLNNHPLLEGKSDKPFYALRDGALVPVRAADVVMTSPLWRWSAAWRWATRTWTARRVADRKLALGQGMPIDLRVHDPACVGGAGGAACQEWDEAWAVTDALFAEMARACGDIPFAILLFPDRVQVERRADWPGAAAWDFDAAQARIARVAGAHAPTFDLLPALRAAGGELYLRDDGHWTARGHDAAARAAAGFVARLTPPPAAAPPP